MTRKRSNMEVLQHVRFNRTTEGRCEMSDAAWRATAAAFRIANPVHPATRAKFGGFADGVLTLVVSDYIEAALDGIRESVCREFTKHSGQPCHTLILDNPSRQPSPEPTTESDELTTLRAALDEARARIATLEADNAELRHELTYQSEWGGGSLALNTDGVFIERDTLRQVATLCLDKDTPRTAAPLFLYILSQANAAGLVSIEAKTICRDVLGFEHRRSWGNLLGDLFGTLVTRAGHQLKVTTGGHRVSESNHTGSPTGESVEVFGNHRGSLTIESNHRGSLETPKVTTGGHFSPVIMNDDDINKKSSIEGSHHSRLPAETQKRLDQRQRELHAIGFNPEMATRYLQTITYAPNEVWTSWLEQAGRGNNAAGLMCSKIKAYHQRHGSRVIDLTGKAS